MLSFMACVAIRESLPEIFGKPTSEQIYKDAPVNFSKALHHMALIARENGCKYAIAQTINTYQRRILRTSRKLHPWRPDSEVFWLLDHTTKPFCFECGDWHMPDELHSLTDEGNK